MWPPDGRTKIVHNSAMSNLVKLGVATLRKIVEPKWLHPEAVLENGETAPGLEPFWLHFFSLVHGSQ